jgi:hypothetical protein
MDPRFGWYYGIVGLLFQAALVVVAIRAYGAKRDPVSFFLMLAAICYVVAASSWYTFPFMAGIFAGPHLTVHTRLVLADSRYYSEQTFQILFALSMIAALLSLIRERS